MLTAIILYFFIVVVTLGYLTFEAPNLAMNYPPSAAAEVFDGKTRISSPVGGCHPGNSLGD